MQTKNEKLLVGNRVINSILENEDIKAATFAKQIGAVPNQIYDIIKGKIQRVSIAMADKILSVYPEYNKTWLLTGEGNMLNETYTGNHLYAFLKYTGLSQIQFANKIGVDSVTIYEVLEGKASITTISEQIKIAFPQISTDWLLSGKGEMIIGEDDIQRELKKEIESQYHVPLLPTSAVGGNLVGMQADGVQGYQCEKVISPIPNIDYAMPIYGDSMTPDYPNGSRVFIKKVNPDRFIEYNNIYVLDTENGAIIKKVMPSDKEGYIKCVSLNPEYLPFEVAIQDIYGWYKVLGCLTLNM